MNEKVWINRRLVDIKKAKVSVFDRGFMYGDGLFETMRCYAGVIFRLDEHLTRLFTSSKAIKIGAPFNKEYLKEAIYKTLDANRLKSAYIKILLTRGEGRFGISHKDIFMPNAVIVAKKFEGYPDWMHKKGISAGVVEIRQNEYSPLAGLKSLNFLGYILARFSAKAKGFDDGILVNTKGYIAEGATSNIFLVKKDAVITPSVDTGILPGITRGVILRLCKRLGVSVKEKLITGRELINADEVFFTNSLAEVLPVTKIDSKRIGDGKPGEITKLLRISYQKEVIREALFGIVN